MIRHKRALAAILVAANLCAAATPAWSLDVPVASPKDQRVRSANYSPHDVVQIDTALGVATHIELADDEEYVTHAFGDSDAYELAYTGRHVLLKPTAEQADTNLIYITDKRSYAFLLKFAKHRSGKEFFRLVMRYPEDEAARQEGQAKSEYVQQALQNGEPRINWESYTMNGDTSLAPVHAWDDGAQTWLRFAPGQDLPAVYMVDAEGQEVVVNRHMADTHTIVLHRVADKWHLRLGSRVLAVHNEAGAFARALPTRTVSPSVERVLRGEASQ